MPKCLFNLYIVDFDFIVICPKSGLILHNPHEKRRLRHTDWFTKTPVASKEQAPAFRLHIESSCVYLLSSLTGRKVKKNMLVMQDAPLERER